MDNIEMTRAEFEVIYAALQMANTPYSDDDETIADLLAKERDAWETVQEVRHRAGLPEWDPPSGDGPTS